jgi:hypothetical protein
MKTNFEALSIDQLARTSGGVTARWLGNHPYAAEAFLDHHPVRDAQFTANHPFLAARIQRIAG